MRRGDIDDAAMLLRLHLRDGGAHRMKRARQVDGDDLVPFLDREILDLLDMLDAGIVDQHVDGAESLRRRGDQVCDLRGFRHIRWVVEGTSLGKRFKPLHYRLDFVRLSEAVDDDVVTLSGKGGGDRKPDAAGGSGDNNGSLHAVLHMACFRDAISRRLCPKRRFWQSRRRDDLQAGRSSRARDGGLLLFRFIFFSGSLWCLIDFCNKAMRMGGTGVSGYVLAIDQGTTSTRAIVFDSEMRIAGAGQKEFTQIYPRSGWVEHDPEEIWDSVVSTIQMALREAKIEAKDIAALGITNQRETVVVWERETGKPIHNAVVWQDRRTASYCDNLKRQGLEKTFTKKTGLILDPYFSGTKLSWLLANVKGARARAAKGELCFGTIDTFLIWRLTGGKSFVTDATNASRTLMYNIAENNWDEDLLEILRVPAAMLPQVKDCADEFGVADASIFGAAIPILGVAGDQQAATIGQACFEPGMMKSTYGTGCFALLNTGADLVRSKNRLLTTIAYRLNGETTYALEGSIFIAGRGRAVAARRPRDHRSRFEDRRACGTGRSDTRGLSRPRLHRTRRAALGPGGARRDLRPHPQQRSSRIRPRGARSRLLPDPRPA